MTAVEHLAPFKVEQAELLDVAERPRRGPLRFVARSELRRPRMRVSGCDLSTFRRNPVVLWRHQIDRLPVGRGDAFIDGDRLLVDIVFDLGDPLGADLDRRYREGFLHAVSASWFETDWMMDGDELVVVEWELLEVSAVVLPRDTGAVAVGGGGPVRLPEEVVGAGAVGLPAWRRRTVGRRRGSVARWRHHRAL